VARFAGFSRNDPAYRELLVALAPTMDQARWAIENAIAVANRGAVYSARQRLEAALHEIAQALDSQLKTETHREKLGRGLFALREAPDFVPTVGALPSQIDVETVARKHRSSILSPADSGLSASQAMELYYERAEEYLAEAAGGVPVASEALFTLGKLFLVQGETQASSGARANRLAAIACFRAALKSDDGNHLAAHELGVLLAREGRLRDARDALQISVSLRPLPETWRNLAVVHQRLGDADLAQRSLAEWQHGAADAAQSPARIVTAANGSSVYWVDKATFEKGSLRAQR
jgi:tetratricopeptide (TPR) repeat protein